MYGDEPVVNYVVLLDTMVKNGQLVVPLNRLLYAFHTFSLRNECVYEPTGDVTFVSPNTDPRSLDGGVERLIGAVLDISVKAYVVTADDIDAKIADQPSDAEILIVTGFKRRVSDLEALVKQARETHHHEH